VRSVIKQGENGYISGFSLVELVLIILLLAIFLQEYPLILAC